MTQDQPQFRQPTEADADQITRIHRQGLETGHASFREAPLGWREFQAAYMVDKGAARVVAHGKRLLGWATVSQTSTRSVYAGVGEISIYLDRAIQGQGIGKLLMLDIIESAESLGYWTIFGHIFPENTSSVALHTKMGFEIVGRRRAIGKMTYGPLAGKWRDLMLMERRSARVGQD